MPNNSSAANLMGDRYLPVAADAVAPDGSLVRLLASASRGGMAHFELAGGEISIAQRHRTVEEIWFILEGLGQMWRESDDGAVLIVEMRPGLSLTIPTGTKFQFRNTGRVPLSAIGVTMPPWPGPDEAEEVRGAWQPILHGEPSTKGTLPTVEA
jgi:mannose-6-phosphate isomerase-like protein (cupin superfamily)